jgi:hypothetical protein
MNAGIVEDRPRIEQVLDLMASLGIVRVVYELNGSGDSGEADLGEVEFAPGRDEVKFEDVPAGLNGSGSPETLASYLMDYAAEHPDGDWVNNEGGQGQVVFLPMEPEGERIVEDMEYNDGYDDDDDPDEYESDEKDDGSEIDEDAEVRMDGEAA